MSPKSIKANVKIKCRNKTEPKKNWKLPIYMRMEQSNVPIGIDGR